MSAYVPPNRKQRDERHYRVTTLCKSRGFPSKNSFSSKWMSNDHSQPNSFLDSGPPVMDKQTIIFREYGMKFDNGTARDRKKNRWKGRAVSGNSANLQPALLQSPCITFWQVAIRWRAHTPKIPGKSLLAERFPQVFRFTGGFGEGKT